MIKTKRVVLLISLLLMVAMLSGCMQAGVKLDLNKDNTGQMTLVMAVAEDMHGDDAEFTFDDMSVMGDDVDGLETTSEEIYYEHEGINYIGELNTIKFDDIGLLFRENTEMTRTDIGNGITRVAVKLGSLVGEEDIAEEDLYAYDMIQAMGGSFVFSIETDHHIVDTNADYIEDNILTWNIFKHIEETDFVAILDYRETDTKVEDTEKEVVEEDVEDIIISDKRLYVEKLLDIQKNDKDFHGKALEKLGILRGTGNGLDLDKPLTRVEGAIVYSRLLGVEEDIRLFNIEKPDYDSGFTDVPAWAEPTINYLHHEGLVAGITPTKYGSDYEMTETQYATLVMRALDFEDGSYTWDTASEVLKALGFYDGDTARHDSILGDQFNRRGMAYISYNALFFGNNETNEYLIDNLIDRLK